MVFSDTRRAALRLFTATALVLCAGAASASTQGDSGAYALGPGDRVRVIVFGEDQLTGEFEVSGAGALSLPLIGDVTVIGLTTPELQAKIADILRKDYIRDPRVSVEVVSYRPFYILGEVNKPGEYPFSSGLTVMEAVATANGFTYRADVRWVYIKHAGPIPERLYPLSSTTLVHPGDVVRVRERYF